MSWSIFATKYSTIERLISEKTEAADTNAIELIDPQVALQKSTTKVWKKGIEEI